MKAIILGSKDTVRRLSSSESYPAALETLDGSGRSVIDWTMSALRTVGVKDVVYVGGYHIEKVVHDHPELKFYYHKNWQRGSDIEALLEAAKEINQPTLILKSNIVFRKEALQLLLSKHTNEFVIGSIALSRLSEQEKEEKLFFREQKNCFANIVDLHQQNPDHSLYRFAEILYIPASMTERTVEVARDCLTKENKGAFLDLIDTLNKQDSRISVVEIGEHWSTLHKTLSMAQFILGTKAQTLERLRPVVKQSIILPQVKFSVSEWEKSREQILKEIARVCGMDLLVVRSSAVSEDSWETSQAGKFRSVLDVDGSKPDEIDAAVRRVIDSYHQAASYDPNNQILIQPRLKDVKISGVMFTRDINHGAPYYIVNYDRKTKRTDTVTSGQGTELETRIIYRDCQQHPGDDWFGRLITAAREIETLLQHDALDIEFAAGDGTSIYFLQIRPLIINNEAFNLADEDFAAELQKIQLFISQRLKPTPNCFGMKTLLGEMPDWNPSEMIGNSPKPLALSLYQTLITDWAWAEARARSGYKNVRPEPLLYALAGKPFIDVRSSFNSFLPSLLNNDIAAKLVSHAIDFLQQHPEYHDKVEFEVMITCHDLDFQRKMDHLLEAGFLPNEVEEIRESYLELTDNLIAGRKAPISEQLDLLNILAQRTKNSLQHDDDAVAGIPGQIQRLVHDCAEYGIVPFSVLARYAFIAMAFLRSLVKKNVFTVTEYEAFLRNIPTVASHFNQDLRFFQSGKMDKSGFIQGYGHLRPSSYDISSMNYAMMVDKGMFSDTSSNVDAGNIECDETLPEKIWRNKSRSITKLLVDNKFSATSEQLFHFITSSIPGRENGKFEFTKNLNLILEKVAKFGEAVGFDRESMAYVSIETIMRLATDSPPSVLQSELERRINYEKKRYALTRSLRLPFLIDGPERLECFELLKWHPNYVTSKKVSGEVEFIKGNTGVIDLSNKIVLIQGADPGYDWIFTKSIAGLITQYGGSASHMAIRASEFGIPAAIGCGDVIVEQVRQAKYVELDCGSQTIRTSI